jgi:hypothetical protein
VKPLELGLTPQERDARDESRRNRNRFIAIGVLLVLLLVLDCAIITNLTLIKP